MLLQPKIHSEEGMLILSDLLVLSVGPFEFNIAINKFLVIAFSLLLNICLQASFLLTDQEQLVSDPLRSLGESCVQIL